VKKIMNRLCTRKTDGTVERRKIFCGDASKDYVLTKYDRLEPDNVHWFEQEEVDVPDGKPSFVRYAATTPPAEKAGEIE
jgi:hypothetical protein